VGVDGGREYGSHEEYCAEVVGVGENEFDFLDILYKFLLASLVL
jgi:hypothetical protein